MEKIKNVPKMETKLHINDKIAKQKMDARKNVQMKHANEKMRKITPDEKQSWNVLYQLRQLCL